MPLKYSMHFSCCQTSIETQKLKQKALYPPSLQSKNSQLIRKPQTTTIIISWNTTAGGWNQHQFSKSLPEPPQKSPLPPTPTQRDRSNSIDLHHNWPRRCYRPNEPNSRLPPIHPSLLRTHFLPHHSIDSVGAIKLGHISAQWKDMRFHELDYNLRELLFENDLPVGGMIKIAVKQKKSVSKGMTKEPTVLNQDMLQGVSWRMQERGGRMNCWLGCWIGRVALVKKRR